MTDVALDLEGRAPRAFENDRVRFRTTLRELAVHAATLLQSAIMRTSEGALNVAEARCRMERLWLLTILQQKTLRQNAERLLAEFEGPLINLLRSVDIELSSAVNAYRRRLIARGVLCGAALQCYTDYLLTHPPPEGDEMVRISAVIARLSNGHAAKSVYDGAPWGDACMALTCFLDVTATKLNGIGFWGHAAIQMACFEALRTTHLALFEEGERIEALECLRRTFEERMINREVVDRGVAAGRTALTLLAAILRESGTPAERTH